MYLNLVSGRPDFPVDYFKAVIRHEFGHALGLRHAHQHPHAPIKKSPEGSDHKELPKEEAIFVYYDSDSIMHYT